jgi:hypothetical protein
MNEPQFERLFKGLDFYSEKDELLFFGRENEAEVIGENLCAYRLTVLYGPGGVGKSSVLQAGVMPALRRASDERVRRKLRPYVPVYFRSWSDKPLQALVSTIMGAARGEQQSDPVQTGTLPAGTLAKAVEACSRSGEVLLILDQFEEYFIQHAGEQGEMTFAQQFPLIADSDALGVKVLISIREDMLFGLDRFKGSIRNLFGNRIRLDRLDRKSGERAIRGPIERYSADQGIPESDTMEDALVQVVLDDVQEKEKEKEGVLVDLPDGEAASDEPLTRKISAPYLQLVMDALCKAETERGSTKLRLGTLQELGGAKAIAKSHVESRMANLRPAERDAAATLFHYLVSPSGAKRTYSFGDLRDQIDLNASELAALLRMLVDARILRAAGHEAGASDDQAHEIYGIFHDILAEPIQQWRQKELTAAVKKGFHQVFDKAFRLLRSAERELWIVNFALKLGAPHLGDPGVERAYTAYTVDGSLAADVENFYATLLSKIHRLPEVRVVTITQDVAIEGFLKPLQKRQVEHGFGGMDIAKQTAIMQQCRDDVAEAGSLNENFLYREIANLPFQILIAGLPGGKTEEPRSGCLVFLVGSEILQLEIVQGAQGFYTETAEIVELFRDHVRALMGPAA